MGYSLWGHREEFLLSCLETHVSVIWPYISVLAWRISGMAGPGGLPSVGSHRVGHD